MLVEVPVCIRLFGAIGFSSPAASGTGQGIIGVALGTTALLFFNCEDEIRFTIVTIKYFFYEAHFMSS